MIILYIPFTRKNAGDLTNLVRLWKKNHQRTSPEPIVILYQNDDFDPDKVPPLTALYICAHGYGSKALEVGNNAEWKKAQRISITTLANHVNSDFLPIAYKLKQIHMYCCGSKSKNANITRQLKENLLRPESTMVFYSGSITIADSNGIRWSLGQGTKVPVEETAVHTFYVHKEEKESAAMKRVSIKKQHESWVEDARIDRHYSFFAQAKQRRLACFDKKRMEAVTPNSVSLLTK